jgi:hypothetical protein
MRKLTLIAATAAAFLSAPAFAATAQDDFDVQLNLTAACTVKTAALDISVAYTAFQLLDATANRTTVFQCTRGLAAPTIAFDATNGTTSATGATATAQGVLKGLRYELAAAAAVVTNGDPAAAGAGGVGGDNGTADEFSFALTLTVPSGQAGAGASGAANHTRSLIITY